jgi:2-desacetyl-2-hydroxyethyl bacteriochlorophyllide A dehydrogenase
MEVIQLKEPGKFVQFSQPVPNGLLPHEALVRVRRIGICGTDLHAFRGVQPYLTYPRVLGHELGVEVVSVGADDHGLKPGDKCAVSPHLNCGDCIACRQNKPNCCVNLRVLGVHIDGGMREFIVLPQDKLHQSEVLSLDQLTLVEPLSIGAHAIARAQIKRGEFVLVVGAGPIGLSVMQFAVLAGARVMAIELNEDRLRFAAEQFPLAQAIKAGDNSVDELKSVTSGDLPTVVVDATGSGKSMADSFKFVAHGGRLIFVGIYQGDVTFNDPDAHRRELTVCFSRNSLGEDYRRIIDQLERREFENTGWVTHRVSFDQIIGEFPRWLNSESGFVKALVEM